MNSWNFKDLTNKKFGKLTVIKRIPTPKGKRKKDGAYWQCRCDCGEELILLGRFLNNGSKTQCNICKKREKELIRKKQKIENKDLIRFKRIWSHMKRRCKPDYKESQWYYDKGIRVCERWLKFKNFKEDMYDSYLEFERINGKNTATIDRINSNRGYSPNNCRWATQLEQAHNRSNNIKIIVDNIEYKTISDLAEAYWIDYHLVHNRYKAGKSGYDLVRTDNIENYNANERYDSNRRLLKRNT